MNVETVARRVRAEFEEMPGMTLTSRRRRGCSASSDEVCRVGRSTCWSTSAYLRQTDGAASVHARAIRRRGRRPPDAQRRGR